MIDLQLILLLTKYFRDIRVKKATEKNVHVLEEYVGRKLSKEEIAYIVVHICAAIERNKNETVRYSVVLVCNGGIGTSQLLLARLEKFFHIGCDRYYSMHMILRI